MQSYAESAYHKHQGGHLRQKPSKDAEPVIKRRRLIFVIDSVEKACYGHQRNSHNQSQHQSLAEILPSLHDQDEDEDKEAGHHGEEGQDFLHNGDVGVRRSGED